ncbi:MAG: hypothetical protein LBH04_06850 [Tannerellaceae bacterium]|jgi:hypothetical protein|nr:hypothetical protein [Tannerellaceae bacterium]
MNTDYNRIEKLAERFFDGLTSNAEEEELYTFFRKEDIPASLEPYRKLFNYIENELPVALAAQPRTSGPRRRLMLWTSIAASLILAAGATILLHRHTDNPFEGSYIIRKGVRITDPKVIRSELEATLLQAELQCEELESLRSQAFEPYEDFIRQIPDEYTQEIVRDFLTGNF